MKLEKKEVIGLQVKTCNRDNQAMLDIGKVWELFMKENILDKIPNKDSTAIYAVYSDFEGDHNDPYLFTLGCEVKPGTQLPEGMKKVEIVPGEYQHFFGKGKMPDVVMETWGKVWSSNLKRSFKSDFEVYRDRSEGPDNCAVEIYIGAES